MTIPTYGSLTDVKAMLGLSPTDTTRDALLNNALASASRLIDRRCGRRFFADLTTTQRIYRPERTEAWYVSGGLMRVDDISTATGLIIEEGYQGYTNTPAGNWTDISNDFILQPDNAFAQGFPVTGLQRAIGVIQDPYILLRVTAYWGWPEVPAEINLATELLTERLFRRKDSPEGFVGTSEWGARNVVRIDPDVEMLIGPYQKPGWA